MRLWSLHPGLLDTKGLVALWREGLLARAVLAGRTRGYRRHPQLQRFLALEQPLSSLNTYLWAVLDESRRRGYRFDAGKLSVREDVPVIPVTRGQLDYEWQHLLNKLRQRDAERFEMLRAGSWRIHPLFEVCPGGIEAWERVGESSASK